jgi:methionyl-tRNA formyltransferase
MRVIFIGTVEFSKKILEKLVDLNVHIVGVCTKKASNLNSDFSNVATVCKKNKIPIKYVKDINSKENIEWIKSLDPDIIFCFGWSSLIKRELLNLPPMGIVGYHPAKLPQNKGRHPLIWTLVLGLKKSASTFFFMDEQADSGYILSQKNFGILITDNARNLYDKVIRIALKQIEEFIPKLQNKSFKTIKQNSKLSNFWRKRNLCDGIIDFRMSSIAIYNLVRALSKPYIGAHIRYKNRDINIWEVKMIKNIQYKKDNIEPGKVLSVVKNTITVKTYDGAIKVLKHEFKKLPTAGEYL